MVWDMIMPRFRNRISMVEVRGYVLGYCYSYGYVFGYG